MRVPLLSLLLFCPFAGHGEPLAPLSEEQRGGLTVEAAQAQMAPIRATATPAPSQVQAWEVFAKLLLAIEKPWRVSTHGEITAQQKSEVASALFTSSASALETLRATVIESGTPLWGVTALKFLTEQQKMELVNSILVASGMSAWSTEALDALTDQQKWQLGNALIVYGPREPWQVSATRQGSAREGWEASVASESVSPASRKAMELRLTATESVGDASPLGVAMTAYKNDPSPERLKELQSLIDKVNARSAAFPRKKTFTR